jgi:hypothetical protein
MSDLIQGNALGFHAKKCNAPVRRSVPAGNVEDSGLLVSRYGAAVMKEYLRLGDEVR